MTDNTSVAPIASTPVPMDFGGEKETKRRAQLEHARVKKAEKKKQREDELAELKEKLSSLTSRSGEMEQRLTNNEVQKEEKSDPTPRVITESKKRKSEEEPSTPRGSVFGDMFNSHNVMKTAALASLAGASMWVRNWRPNPLLPGRNTAAFPSSSSSSSSSSASSAPRRDESVSYSPMTSPPPSPREANRFSPPFTRPVRLESRNPFV